MSLFWTEEESEYQHRGWKITETEKTTQNTRNDYLEQGSRMEEACFEEPQRVLAGSQLKQMHTITTLCTGVLCSD